ncbi:single-stranded-DNA-specific exonuclease RecJ [Saccharibacillus sp. CPCC 101409]|uniref:single-stranded-DNA-specific exonuclease RecJ n=1 Tax=Saccharibacillus sp. CPCC 101409 TaxID=3058041 RepID=UPI002671CBD4|nr:single-stranded-DNA-specific exonuclease RecJ [Saccharibacillus sp. CPCC 101409]MDO3409007.1 single-stranded-DNA-specific exonuclease RecJ [Saccharibacillus sp. CPCC 101409]
MLHSQYQWKVSNPDPGEVERLSEQLDISPLLASMLLNRGFEDRDSASSFLDGDTDLSGLHDPFLLHGMDRAVERIRTALANVEKIWVYGDYDADGVSSTALMIRLMTRLNADFGTYIPHRSKEGYGLHNHAIDRAAEEGVKLIVTVDTGISAVQQIAYAASLGIDVVVTDHHEPPAILPEAVALVNPKLPMCGYPFKGLAGVGVAFKLAHALLGEPPEEWLGLAAIGTVADLMPLTGENRLIVARGIEEMRRNPSLGVQQLLEAASSRPDQLTSIGIAFAMAPRINASGRLDHADRAVKLLITDDRDEAEHLASVLDLLNKERQKNVEDIVHEATAMLELKIAESGEVPHVIVLAGEGWNVGVVGIVASKILERYYRPTVILGIDAEKGMCKGSARSIPDFDIYEALLSVSETMDHFGGHPSAAGMSLSRERLAGFEAGLNDYAAGVLTPDHLVAVTSAERECSLSDVPIPVIEELERMAPFGMNNPSPQLVFRNVRLQRAITMGKTGTHLKLVVEQDGQAVEAVAFGKGALAEYLTEGDMLDLLAEPSINEWRGSRKPQLMVRDLALPALQVFDRRTPEASAQTIEDFRKRAGAFLSCAAEEIAVAIGQTTLKVSQNTLARQPIWLYDEDSGIQGTESVQPSAVRTLFVRDMPETAAQLDRLLTSFSALENIVLLYPPHSPADVLREPDRELVKTIYVELRRSAARPVDEGTLVQRLCRTSGCSPRMIAGMLDVFAELDFIERSEAGIAANPSPPKKALDEAESYRRLREAEALERRLLGGASEIGAWLKQRAARLECGRDDAVLTSSV